MKSIWEEEVTVLLIYIVTIACFPAICVLVQSTHYHTGIILVVKLLYNSVCPSGSPLRYEANVIFSAAFEDRQLKS